MNRNGILIKEIKIVCDETNNPPSVLENEEVYIDIGFPLITGETLLLPLCISKEGEINIR